MSTIDSICRVSFWLVTTIALIWACVGLIWVGQLGNEGLWLDLTTAFALFWVGLVGYAAWEGSRGRH